MSEKPASSASFLTRVLQVPLSSDLQPLLFFSVIIFFAYLGDGILTYVSPLFIETFFGSAWKMGLMLGFSSVVAVVCDISFPHFLRTKKYLFFLWSTTVFALLCPVLYLLFPFSFFLVCLEMILWGIYFELLVFANYHFVHAFIVRTHYALAWGILDTVINLSIVISPLIASALLHIDPNYTLYSMVIFFSLSLLGILLFNTLFPEHHKATATYQESHFQDPKQEIRVWWTLLKTLWPLFLFVVALYALHSVVLYIGALLSEQLLSFSFWGHWVIVSQLAPGLFVIYFLPKLSSIIGKKRVAFLSGGLGGVLLFFAGQTSYPGLMILLFFLSAIFITLAFPAVYATIQDYMERLGLHRNHIIGLQNASTSIGFLIGQVFGGLTASVVGNQRTFSVFGFLLLLTSIIALLVIPRKVRLPQTTLKGISLNSSL